MRNIQTVIRAALLLQLPELAWCQQLRAKKNVGHAVLFNEHFGAKYLRTQDWKLVAQPGEKIWHLYKINEEESELNNLAAQYPDKVKELTELWTKWANENNVLPKPKG